MTVQQTHMLNARLKHQKSAPGIDALWRPNVHVIDRKWNHLKGVGLRKQYTKSASHKQRAGGA